MDAISERSALAALLSAYFAAVDDKRLDADVVAATFTPDATMTRPNGTTVTGREAILSRQSESFARFRATQHMLTDHLVELDGDVARLRVNVQAVHLWGEGRHDPAELASHFVAGGVLRAAARRTPDGWRLSEIAMRPTWRTGAGLGVMARS